MEQWGGSRCCPAGYLVAATRPPAQGPPAPRPSAPRAPSAPALGAAAWCPRRRRAPGRSWGASRPWPVAPASPAPARPCRWARPPRPRPRRPGWILSGCSSLWSPAASTGCRTNFAENIHKGRTRRLQGSWSAKWSLFPPWRPWAERSAPACPSRRRLLRWPRAFVLCAWGELPQCSARRFAHFVLWAKKAPPSLRALAGVAPAPRRDWDDP
mmetsp:Transcript_61369/g.97278  ORF Transcript_61369/g.97278 Transcript_61369/m.97278 type:complete len:212 (-) Transcript_61369:191-826(-)